MWHYCFILFSVGQPPCAPTNTDGELVKLKHDVSKSLVDSSTQTLHATGTLNINNQAVNT